MSDSTHQTENRPKNYTVRFFKTLCNDVGRETRICQKSVMVSLAQSPEAAVDAARMQFIRSERMPPSIFSCLDIEVSADEMAADEIT